MALHAGIRQREVASLAIGVWRLSKSCEEEHNLVFMVLRIAAIQYILKCTPYSRIELRWLVEQSNAEAESEWFAEP